MIILDSFDKSLQLMKKVEEFSLLNKILKDRNDELEIKRCQKCQMLPKRDLEEENVKNIGLDDGYSKRPLLFKVLFIVTNFHIPFP